jgi:hypothetical protein
LEKNHGHFRRLVVQNHGLGLVADHFDLVGEGQGGGGEAVLGVKKESKHCGYPGEGGQ